MGTPITGIMDIEANNPGIIPGPQPNQWAMDLYFDVEEEEVLFRTKTANLIPHHQNHQWVCDDLQDIAIHQSNRLIEHMEHDRLENIEHYDPPLSMVESVFTPEFRTLCVDSTGNEFLDYIYESDYVKLLTRHQERPAEELMRMACDHTANISQKFAKSVQHFCWQKYVNMNNPEYFVFPGPFGRFNRSTTLSANQVVVTHNPDRRSISPAQATSTLINENGTIHCTL